jgi:hypothetical protein
MSITIQNVVNASAGGSGTVTTASLGSVSTGDLIVVGAGSYKATTLGTLGDSVGGNTYTKIAARDDGANAGAVLYYSIITNGGAGFTVNLSSPGAVENTIVVWWITGASAYNTDEADAANFSGSSTAWQVGPTTSTPPANSICLYVGSVGTTQASLSDATGFNTTGVNGFTAGMDAAAQQLLHDSTHCPCFMGYKITSTTETPAVTLQAAADWFGVVASFSPSGGGGGAATSSMLIAQNPVPMRRGPGGFTVANPFQFDTSLRAAGPVPPAIDTPPGYRMLIPMRRGPGGLFTRAKPPFGPGTGSPPSTAPASDGLLQMTCLQRIGD